MLRFKFWVFGGLFTLITLATNSFRLVKAKPTWPTEDTNDFPILSIDNRGKIAHNEANIDQVSQQGISSDGSQQNLPQLGQKMVRSVDKSKDDDHPSEKKEDALLAESFNQDRGIQQERPFIKKRTLGLLPYILPVRPYYPPIYYGGYVGGYGGLGGINDYGGGYGDYGGLMGGGVDYY